MQYQMQMVLFLRSFYIVVIKILNKNKHKNHLIFPASVWMSKWKVHLMYVWEELVSKLIVTAHLRLCAALVT